MSNKAFLRNLSIAGITLSGAIASSIVIFLPQAHELTPTFTPCSGFS